MTQSGPNRKFQTPKPKAEVVITEPETPKTELELRIEELKEKKPHIYEEYRNAIKSQKRASIGPDLSLRIG
jgi:hypothetical protein